MRRVSVVVAAVVGLAVFPTGAAAAGFSLGVTAGEVTSGSAIVWAHATSSGSVGVQIARDKNFRRVVGTGSIKAKSSNDNTVQVQVRRLAADTAYYYRFSQGTKKSEKGTFRTAPAANKAKTIRFAFSGDEDAQRARGSSTPFYNTVGDRNFAVFNAMKRENNHFNINFGDTIYSDSEVGDRTFVNGVYQGFAPALSVKDKWAKYRMNLAMANLRNLRGSAGMYNHWDDHEFINDFGPNETLIGRDANGVKFNIPGSSVRGNGVKAFRDYMPVTYSSRNGIYRSVRWGKNLELFFLDERSFRSAKAGSPTISTCNNPDTGAADLAPTLPQPRRNFFAALAPSLARPVSPACLAAINDPNRTLLGSRQRNAFENAVKRSTATFKVIMNEVPIQEFFALPYDRWEAYAAERTALLTFLKDNVKNVIFLTTDEHADLVNDARFSTFSEQGGAKPSGITDVIVGPVATMTFKREINKEIGQDPGTGTGASLLDSLILTPPPDQGLGMSCSVIDTFSYGQVTVTSTKLTVEIKDQNRATVREEEGAKPACPKIVLNKQ